MKRTRYFWYRVVREAEDRYFTTDEVICYQFTRLPIDLTFSPFLLSAAARELATTQTDTFPKVAMLVDRSTYMDDFVAGAEDDSNVIAIYYLSPPSCGNTVSRWANVDRIQNPCETFGRLSA